MRRRRPTGDIGDWEGDLPRPVHFLVRLSAGLAPLALALIGTCDPALAHTGSVHAASFVSGFAHPWTGLDHMLALLAVGLWAGLIGGRALWAWPAAFVSAMLAGGVLAIAGASLPLVEPGMLASLVVLGLLVLTAARPPIALGAALVAVFAVLHGHAHGAELPGPAAAATYAAGFTLATALLHAIGIAIACVSRGAIGALFVRIGGAAVAAVGVALAVI